MNNTDIKKLLEAILFVASEPLSIKELTEILQEPQENIERIMEELKKDYEDKGIKIIQISDEFKMTTSPVAAPIIEKFHKVESRHFLSRAALETLSIIAFKQPVTRAQIEELRGVNVDGIIYNLLDKKLIKEAGRASIPGHPILYGTTKEFLRYFNLNNLEELVAVDRQIEENPTELTTQEPSSGAIMTPDEVIAEDSQNETQQVSGQSDFDGPVSDSSVSDLLTANLPEEQKL